MTATRVLLVCGSGASTAFMANAIRKSAKKQGLDMSVKARSESELENYLDEIDVLLVGPHLEYMLQEVTDLATPHGIVVKLIPKSLYGSLDGEGVLNSLLLPALAGQAD
jgi:PTS system cellobiose-specific IIB component